MTNDTVVARLERLGITLDASAIDGLTARSPIDGAVIGHVATTEYADLPEVGRRAQTAFHKWRAVPAPRRGELVRLLGQVLRENKEALGWLVSLEAGKIVSEGLGEVQEMIDICDFAVGLSRQLYGLNMPSERSNHRLMETWHPAGPCLVITAFNFPVAVWSWNAAIALVCGDPIVWKPSEKTPLTALAVHTLFKQAVEQFGDAPADLNQVVIGDRSVGRALAEDRAFPIISATGSTRMGRDVAHIAASRFAKTILELGGNNASIVTPSADLDLVKRAVSFSAVGTAGQRCTSLRRLFVHESVHYRVLESLKSVFSQVRIGDPLDPETMVGPLIDQQAFHGMQEALTRARSQGATVFGGERVLEDRFPEAFYVRPALVVVPDQSGVVLEETFAPILYVMPYTSFEQAVVGNNAVSYGLSSSIFSNDLREIEWFLSAQGSDCGIANVNMGPSGAEIGGAFGGEKDTGGGRESGSDAWKAYMRRATTAINYGRDLPLAQGVKFDV